MPVGIREVVKESFGADLPISGGWGNSMDAALVIHYQEPNDYVSVEYEFINCIAKYSGFAWEPISQNLINENNKKYDILQIEAVAKKAGEVRKKIMNFHFDITECFGR